MDTNTRIRKTTQDLQNSRLFAAVLEAVKGIEDRAKAQSDDSYVGSLEEELSNQTFLDGGDF